MPLEDKEITEDQKDLSEEIALKREREFEQDENLEGSEFAYFSGNVYTIKEESDKKKNDSQNKKNHYETVLNSLSRIQSNRSSFQKAVAQSRKDAETKVGVLVK